MRPSGARGGIGVIARLASREVGLVGDIADVVIGGGLDQAVRPGRTSRSAHSIFRQAVERVVTEVLRRAEGVGPAPQIADLVKDGGEVCRAAVVSAVMAGADLL